MSLDLLADAVNPLLLIALFAVIIGQKRAQGVGTTLVFLAVAVLAVGICQQGAKWAQSEAWVSADFPSTHFAVHLSALSLLWFLLPHRWPLWVGTGLGYGALMLWQDYHSLLEMLGSFYAVPLTLLVVSVPKLAQTVRHVPTAN